jgi:NifU-like protein involved in Fe-S cluster formation
MSIDPYNELVREYFATPEHAGELQDAASGYFEDQGVRLRFSATLDGDRVAAMRFAAWGCPHVIAAAEAVCRHFEGQALSELDKFPRAQIMDDLAVPVEKTGRILVVEDTVRSLRAAISDRIASKPQD